jgi:hypothetical protein
MASKIKRVATNPINVAFGPSKTTKKPIAQIERPEPINPNIKSASAARVEATSRAQGLSAPAVRGRIGDPAEMSGQQRIAIAVQRAGFGGDFAKSFKEDAKKFLIRAATEDPESPHYRSKTYIPSEGDIKAQAFDMANRRIESVKEPKLRSALEKMARTAFGREQEPGTQINLQKGVTKADKPRKGITGEGAPAELTDEEKARIAAEQAELRPISLANAGVSEDVLRGDIAKMKEAIDEGDERKYYQNLRKFEQRLAAHQVLRGEVSPVAAEFTSSKDVGGMSRESQGRKQIYDESGPRKPGSDTEGKTSIKGTISREPRAIAKDALDLIAVDEDLRNEFLSRYNPQDQKALLAKFNLLKDSPDTDAGELARGQLLRTFTKALSIEGLAKNMAITAEGQGAKQKRALSQVAPSPVVELARKDELAQNKQRVRSAIDAIAGIRVGYNTLPINEQRKRLVGDIKTIMSAFGGYTENRMILRSVKQAVSNAAGKAAAGDLEPINKIGKALKLISSGRQIASAEKQIAGRKGDMSQLEAIMTGLGTSVRGGPSTRAAKRGIVGTSAQTGSLPRPSQRTEVNYPSRSMKEAEAGIPAKVPAESTGQATFVPTRERGEAARKTGSIGSPRLQKGVVELRGRNQDLGPKKPDLESKEYVPPPSVPGKRQAVKAPAQSALADAIDEYMSDINAESGAAGDVQYGGQRGSASPESMQRARRLLTSRIKQLTIDSKKELSQLTKSRLPAEIRNANQLEAAKARLAKLESLKADADATYRNIPQMLEMVVKEAPGGQGYESAYQGDTTTFRRSETEGALFATKQTVGEYREHLQNRIKLLDGQVSGYQKAIAKAVKEGKIKGRDVGVALREGERGEMNPQRMQLSRLRQNLDKARKAGNAQLEKKLARDIESLQKSMEIPKRVRPGANDPAGVETRSGYVRSDQPLPEMFAPRKTASEPDIREVTGGEFSGGKVEKPGRKISPERRRAKKAKLKPRRDDGNRSADLLAISRNRNLAGLIEGLPA